MIHQDFRAQREPCIPKTPLKELRPIKTHQQLRALSTSSLAATDPFGLLLATSPARLAHGYTELLHRRPLEAAGNYCENHLSHWLIKRWGTPSPESSHQLLPVRCSGR